MESYKIFDTSLGFFEDLIISSLIDDSRGLVISLAERLKNKKVEMVFPPVYSYRSSVHDKNA